MVSRPPSGVPSLQFTSLPHFLLYYMLLISQDPYFLRLLLQMSKLTTGDAYPSFQCLFIILIPSLIASGVLLSATTFCLQDLCKSLRRGLYKPVGLAPPLKAQLISLHFWISQVNEAGVGTLALFSRRSCNWLLLMLKHKCDLFNLSCTGQSDAPAPHQTNQSLWIQVLVVVKAPQMIPIRYHGL